MKCDTAVDLVVDSLLDTLDDVRRTELEAHLATCAACASEAEAMRAMWSDLARLDAPEASPRTAIELGRRLSEARPGRTPSAHRIGRRWSPVWRAAAAIALLLIGAAAGYMARGGGAASSSGSGATAAATNDSNQFLLLVRADDALTAPVSGAALVGEYADWARELGQQGRLVDANKLTDEPGRWLSTASSETRSRSDVSGYLLISAADYDEAMRIASASPHIRYGGTFEIRQVDVIDAGPPTN